MSYFGSYFGGGGGGSSSNASAAYTLGEIMSQLTYGIGRRSDLASSYLSFKVNEAWEEVSHSAPHALLEKKTTLSLLSGSALADLPSDFAEPITLTRLENGSGQTLAYVSSGVLDSSGTAAGKPVKFIYFGDQIEVRPVPSQNFSALLRYRAQPNVLMDLTDYPSCSTPWRRAVLLKARALVQEDNGDIVGAAASEDRYLSYVMSLPSDRAVRQEGEYPQGVRVAW